MLDHIEAFNQARTSLLQSLKPRLKDTTTDPVDQRVRAGGPSLDIKVSTIEIPIIINLSDRQI
jgi:hypothetical protein